MNIGTISQAIDNVSIKVLSKPIQLLEQTKAVRKCEDYLSKELTTKSGEKILRLNKLQKHLPGILGLWITGFYAQSILNNKDIPKERKTPLFINNLFCGAVGVSAGYAVKEAINKFEKPFIPRFEKVLEKQGLSPDKIEKLSKVGLHHSLIPLLAFSFAFRYLAPVIATPLADKVNKFLVKHNLIKDPKAAKSNQSLEKFNNWSSNLPKINLDINK
ncbi:MAG: hypothetical protein A2039_06055 [Candidatus Melainabacteria bacterium GWA2_34_9]|nr:MAG: hypothetical protein A2039_06055 [Candidatus Melainabacteria bacterium GWA2_34_9]